MTQARIVVPVGTHRIELRESESTFLKWCCCDMSYRDIAAKMELSPRTIDGIRDDLFDKLRVRSRTGLVLWCFKTGLLKRKDIILTVRRKKKRGGGK